MKSLVISASNAMYRERASKVSAKIRARHFCLDKWGALRVGFAAFWRLTPQRFEAVSGAAPDMAWQDLPVDAAVPGISFIFKISTRRSS